MESKMIGNKIAEARKNINISQALLAQRLFISPQAVGKWERGESLPDIITLNRLAQILGVDLNYFSENFQSAGNESTADEFMVRQQLDAPSENQKHKLSWDMSRGNWVNADFSGLKNLKEKFSSSNMKNCKFAGSDMSGLLLKNNNIHSCDFSGSDINTGKVESSNLVSNLFVDCLLNETTFSESHIKNCDFTGADLSGATFNADAFIKNTITHAVLHRTSFNETQLSDIVFEGTLEDCAFDNCAFARVTFQNAKLINTFFKCRNLKRIQFINCQADRMTYEFLKNGKADLSGITLIKE